MTGVQTCALPILLRINAEQGTTVVVVTHDPEVAARLPRTVTIRDGRIGGEGRSGQEYAVVTADGFVPLPVHLREELPPGTLLRIERVEDGYLLAPEVLGHEVLGHEVLGHEVLGHEVSGHESDGATGA